MTMESIRFWFLASVLLLSACTAGPNKMEQSGKQVHQDTPFLQDYSIKYYQTDPAVQLLQVASDRNGAIRILSSDGLRKPHSGAFLYPGTIEPDNSYRPMADKKISSIGSYQDQLVYLDIKAVLSNAWAGELFSIHDLPPANLFRGGKDFAFLVSDGTNLKLVKDSAIEWEGNLSGENILQIRYHSTDNQFWILTASTLHEFDPSSKQLQRIIGGEGFTSFDLSPDKNLAYVGTTNGYLVVDTRAKEQKGEPVRKVPVTGITAISHVNGNIWFGSEMGAFMLREDGKYNYYYGERWLPGNVVVDIAAGPDNSVLILTQNGLAQIRFQMMTLEEKAMYFQKQVRNRHIRHGFNASIEGMKQGNLSTGYLRDSDNDGLWTSMYLGAEIFRYAVTKSDDALQNCIESLEAMERLYTINPVEGFPSRSFERRGYIEILSDPERWQHASDPEWDWKATTSSDEAIGHIFAMGALAELIEREDLRNRAIHLIDILMQHIIDNDWYLIDYDGKPTLWGRWNPEYVNGFPIQVGDRKLNSSNIVAMLQTAYHFTKKEVYREKAFELMEKHGYLENLMRPMSVIGEATGDADDWSKMLSESWNHSDDEMYFLGYWGLYRYAFDDDLKAKYREAIVDHWEAERPEKEGLWNIMTALAEVDHFDLEEAIWYLQEHPLDLINWDIRNSHRKDIEFIEPNFRRQTLTEVLPPDERPVQRHNGNMFNNDRERGNGTGEHSAGDIWLLPYWMGRYLGVIGEPAKK
jgi:hypothetical protein